jgi:hypothetical protein
VNQDVSTKETDVASFKFCKGSRYVHHVLVNGRRFRLCIRRVLYSGIRVAVAVVDTDVLLRLSKFVRRCLLAAILVLFAFKFSQHLGLIVGLIIWFIEGVVDRLPIRIICLDFLVEVIVGLILQTLFDVMKHIGGEFQQFFAFVLLTVDLDGGGVVGETGHLE